MDPNCSKDTGAPPVYACESAVKPGTLKCALKHCNNYPETQDWKAYCKCIDWQGNKIPNCDPKGNTVPIQAFVCYNKVTGEQCTTTDEECQERRDKDKNWIWKTCYCCCSCFAWNTLILVGENKVKVIQDIEENEEIYTAYSSKPIILPKSNGALKVLQYIRDEAHRFGLAYNVNLRKIRS